MKVVWILVLSLCFVCCTEKKEKKSEEMMPVEADGGIGDGAPPLDSVLSQSKDSIR